MKRFALAATAVAAVTLAFGAAVVDGAASTDDGARATADEHHGVLSLEATDCFQTLERRPVLLSQVEAYLPDRYEPRPTPTPPYPIWGGDSSDVTVSVGFSDHVCGTLSVNGHAGEPTIVSVGTVFVTRDGVATEHILWYGTDNPLLFARLQQLGTNVYFLPQSSYSERYDEAGRREITVRYVDSGPAGLDYTRTTTVLTEPVGPTRTQPSRFYHLGRLGELEFEYALTLAPNGTAAPCVLLDPESLPLEYGITNFPEVPPAKLGCFPQRNFFRIPSFTATIQRVVD